VSNAASSATTQDQPNRFPTNSSSNWGEIVEVCRSLWPEISSCTAVFLATALYFVFQVSECRYRVWVLLWTGAFEMGRTRPWMHQNQGKIYRYLNRPTDSSTCIYANAPMVDSTVRINLHQCIKEQRTFSHSRVEPGTTERSGWRRMSSLRAAVFVDNSNLSFETDRRRLHSLWIGKLCRRITSFSLSKKTTSNLLCSMLKV